MEIWEEREKKKPNTWCDLNPWPQGLHFTSGKWYFFLWLPLQLNISYYAQEILNVTTLYPFLDAEEVWDTNFTLPVIHFRFSRLDEAILQNEINKWFRKVVKEKRNKHGFEVSVEDWNFSSPSISPETFFFSEFPARDFFSFEIFKMSFCSSFLHPTFLSFFTPNFLSFFLFSQALALSVLLLRFPIWEILHLAWSGHLLQQTKTKNNDFKLKSNNAMLCRRNIA